MSILDKMSLMTHGDRYDNTRRINRSGAYTAATATDYCVRGDYVHTAETDYHVPRIRW